MAKSNNNGVINLFEKKSDSKGDGIKYSELLERLMEPFENEFPEEFYQEDALSLAMSAWNFANLKDIMPSEEFEKVMNMAPDSGEDIVLLKKMIDRKYKEFRNYDRFIADFELKEEGGEPILSVLTQEKEAYLQEMVDEADAQVNDGFDEDDYEEGFVNRSAITVVPKTPFFEWYKALYPDNPIREEIKAANTYLVDYFNAPSEMEAWLDKRFDYFFKSELNEWHSKTKDWPKKRTYAMFKEWFQVISCMEVYDTEMSPVRKG